MCEASKAADILYGNGGRSSAVRNAPDAVYIGFEKVPSHIAIVIVSKMFNIIVAELAINDGKVRLLLLSQRVLLRVNTPTEALTIASNPSRSLSAPSMMASSAGV